MCVGELQDRWKSLVIDSGWTQHMIGDPRMFTSLDEVDGQERITFGDNSKGKVKGLGKVARSHNYATDSKLKLNEATYSTFEIE